MNEFSFYLIETLIIIGGAILVIFLIIKYFQRKEESASSEEEKPMAIWYSPDEKALQVELLHEWLDTQEKQWFYKFTMPFINKRQAEVMMKTMNGEETLCGTVYFRYDKAQPRVSMFKGIDQNGNLVRKAGMKLIDSTDEAKKKAFILELEEKPQILDEYFIDACENGLTVINPEELLNRKVDKRDLKAFANAIKEVGNFTWVEVQNDFVVVNLEK